MVLPVLVLLIGKGVPVDLEIMAVSEHPRQVVRYLTRLQVFSPLAWYFAFAQGVASGRLLARGEVLLLEARLLFVKAQVHHGPLLAFGSIDSLGLQV